LRRREWRSSLSQIADELLDFAGVRKAPHVVLREDQRAVDPDVEDAVLTMDQLRIDSKLLLEGGGQTGRPRQVVSGNTPGDGNVHRTLRISTIRRVPGISNVDVSGRVAR
jgi:hypothetical protein